MTQFYKFTMAAVVAAVMSVPTSLFAQDGLKVATFEDVQISSEDGYWCGPTDNAVAEPSGWGYDNQVGTFTDGSFEFSNSYYNGSFLSWSGFACSNRTATSFDALTMTPDQFNSSVGHGVDGSAKYGVAYNGGTVKVLNATDGAVVNGFYITNNAYAINSMTNGDSYAKKFEQGDFFKVIFTGTKADKTTSKVEFYLADFSSQNTTDHYMVKDWTYVDLSSLGKVVSISFSFDSSDKSYGYLNTPTYFCLDNFGAANTSTGISKPANMVDVYEGARYTIDGKRISAPQKGINIIRMSDGSTRKVVVK